MNPIFISVIYLRFKQFSLIWCVANIIWVSDPIHHRYSGFSKIKLRRAIIRSTMRAAVSLCSFSMSNGIEFCSADQSHENFCLWLSKSHARMHLLYISVEGVRCYNLSIDIVVIAWFPKTTLLARCRCVRIVVFASMDTRHARSRQALFLLWSWNRINKLSNYSSP